MDARVYAIPRTRPPRRARSIRRDFAQKSTLRAGARGHARAAWYETRVKGSALVDVLLVLAPSFALALLVTAHVALVASLARRAPRWRAAVALVVPPLAVVWGNHEKFRKWCAVWLAALALYVVTLAFASLA